MFPHTQQIIRIYRERSDLDDSPLSTETAYFLTSLPADQADPEELGHLARGH